MDANNVKNWCCCCNARDGSSNKLSDLNVREARIKVHTQYGLTWSNYKFKAHFLSTMKRDSSES